MANFPTTFADTVQELPEHMPGTAETAKADLAEKGYKVVVGLTEVYAADLIKMTQEPHIKENCPNDSGKRFMDIEATREWLTKNGGRAVFLLVRLSDNALAGYGWTGVGGAAEFPDGKVTFAIRVGEIGLGQRLSTSFSKMIILGSAKLYGAKDIWLETWLTNEAAIHAYHNAGFVDVGRTETEVGTRLFMRYPNELLLDT